MANDNSKLTPVSGHLEPDLSHDFDTWRRAQPKIPTVSKGVAYLMRLGLQVEARRKARSDRATTESAATA
jgi:hypothetical protein